MSAIWYSDKTDRGLLGVEKEPCGYSYLRDEKGEIIAQLAPEWRSAGGWREGKYGVLLYSCILIQFKRGPELLWHPLLSFHATTKAFAADPPPPLEELVEKLRPGYRNMMRLVTACMEIWVENDMSEEEIKQGVA